MEFDPGSVVAPGGGDQGVGRSTGNGERLSRRRLIGLLVAGAVIAATASAIALSRSGRRPRATAAVERVVPEGTRIKVEVLNATDIRGLARTATFALRDAGFDVVFFGNTVERHDSTVVRDRSGHMEWAALAARTMAPARTEVRADSGRLVDLSVLVGRRWTPPAQALRP